MIDRRLARGIEQAIRIGHVERRGPNPAVWAYRWRYELGLLAVLGGLGYAVHAGSWEIPVGVGLLGLVVGAAAVLSRPFRAMVWTRVMSVVIQHRLRTAFSESGLSTWRGRLPAILWTSPRRAGVRVLVSCPAGVEVGDLEALRTVLAAACFASDVVVERHRRFGNLVVLVVITQPVGPAAPGQAARRPPPSVP